MKDRLRPKGLLLDFYGTLVKEDHAPVDHVCARIASTSPKGVSPGEVRAHWGRLFDETCLRSHGAAFLLQREIERRSLRAVLEHFAAPLEEPPLSEVIIAYWRRPGIFPDSRAFLAACPLPVCLVSNADDADLFAALGHNRLSFEFIVTSEDCRAYKPRPELFEKALARLGLENREALHIGDSLRNDIAGAGAMGIPAIWMNREQRKLPPGAERPSQALDDLGSLLALLDGAGPSSSSRAPGGRQTSC